MTHIPRLYIELGVYFIKLVFKLSWDIGYCPNPACADCGNSIITKQYAVGNSGVDSMLILLLHATVCSSVLVKLHELIRQRSKL